MDARRHHVTSRIALAAVLASALLVGCSQPSATHPPAAPGPVSAPATSAPSASTSTAPPAAASGTTAPSTDAAGGAIGTAVKPSGVTKPPVAGPARPSDALAIKEARRLLTANEGAVVKKIAVSAMTQDSKGDWWVLLAITDANLGRAQGVITYNGSKWDDAIYGQSVTTGDLPPDVKF